MAEADPRLWWTVIAAAGTVLAFAIYACWTLWRHGDRFPAVLIVLTTLPMTALAIAASVAVLKGRVN